MKTPCKHCGSDSFDLLISQIALDRAKAELAEITIKNERLQKLLDAARFGSDKIAVPNY